MLDSIQKDYIFSEFVMMKNEILHIGIGGSSENWDVKFYGANIHCVAFIVNLTNICRTKQNWTIWEDSQIPAFFFFLGQWECFMKAQHMN